RETTLLVVHPEAAAELDPGHTPGLVAPDLDRPPAVPALDALLVALDDLDRVGGHLLERLERHEVHAAAADETGRRARGVESRLPDDGACDVVGDVAAADHDGLVAEVERLVERDRTQQVHAA